MARKQLIEEIRQLDGQLAVEQSLLRLEWRERQAYLQQLSPLWLVGGGLVAGVLVGVLKSSGNVGLVSLGLGSLRAWRLTSLLVPGLAITPPDIDA